MEYKMLHLVSGYQEDDSEFRKPIAAFKTNEEAVLFTKAHEDWTMDCTKVPLYKSGVVPHRMRYYSESATIKQDGTVKVRGSIDSETWDYNMAGVDKGKPAITRGMLSIGEFFIDVVANSRSDAVITIQRLIAEARADVDNC